MKAAPGHIFRSVLAVLAGMTTVLVMVFGTVLLLLPEWTQPGGFPRAAPALAGLLALEIAAGIAGTVVVILLAPRLPIRHGVVLGGLLFILNLLTVVPPDSPWPPLAAILLMFSVPLQVWCGIVLGLGVRRRAGIGSDRQELSRARAAADGE